MAALRFRRLSAGSRPSTRRLWGPVTQSVGTPAATLSGVPTASSVNANVSGAVTLVYIATAYAVLYHAGADEGARTAFRGLTTPVLHPLNIGTYTLRIYTALTGGTLLAESPSITVTAAVPLATSAR